MYIKEKEYISDVERVANAYLPWEKLQGKKVLITGASGLIGTFLIDVLMRKNQQDNLMINICAIGRNIDKAMERFHDYGQDKNFIFYPIDINHVIDVDFQADYIIHAASNTHPRLYANDPIGSIMTNLLGTYNLLEYVRQRKTERFVFLSSVEIYGEARTPEDIFDELYCGYIDCNTVRAGYPEGKRAGESLCNAYMAKYSLDIVIPRLSRIYGPTMRIDDSKAMSQFIMNGVRGEDIVLKSDGSQRYSYCYVADAVLGVFYTWLLGKCGEAYNIANTGKALSLREIVDIIADFTGKKVIFSLPDNVETAGYSRVLTGIMNAKKLKKLGWNPFDNIDSGIKKTIKIMRNECLTN